MNFQRQPPPPGLIAAAEQDYHAARDELDQMIAAARTVLANEFSEVEAVTDVWLSLHVQQDNPIVLLLSAAAIVRLAKAPATPPERTRP
ncbi:hypothetical protein AB0M54_14280 [Actinoplanes sp. NPDC051470]|uniref:hypothetical protein n=1 Tax=Actinoplanes sp. NPDC051470 TaxID=3157224 RepID=UPI003437D674